jgi:hypothetical protein
MPKEKRSINLPTCRATPSEEARLMELLEAEGYEKIAHFWRRCLTQYIKQNEPGHETESPLRFVEKEKRSDSGILKPSPRPGSKRHRKASD